MNGIITVLNVSGLVSLALVALMKVGVLHALIVAQNTKSAQHRVHWTMTNGAIVESRSLKMVTVVFVALMPVIASNANR